MTSPNTEQNAEHSVSEFQRFVIEQIHQMRLEIADNTTLTLEAHEATKKIEKANEGVLALFNNYTSAIKILKGIQAIAIWISKVAGAFFIIWLAFRFGVLEAIEHMKAK